MPSITTDKAMEFPQRFSRMVKTQCEEFGWEAWTRTRIPRVRVWCPTNWTTSQPVEVLVTKTNRSGYPMIGTATIHLY